MTDFILYTDGGARGNPGPSGAGWVVQSGDGETLAEGSKFLGMQTNNAAEYDAVLLGLEHLKRLAGAKLKTARVEVRLDSELVARQLSGHYQIKEATLFPKFIAVHNFQVAHSPSVSFTHIPRAHNARADALANRAMDAAA